VSRVEGSEGRAINQGGEITVSRGTGTIPSGQRTKRDARSTNDGK